MDCLKGFVIIEQDNYVLQTYLFKNFLTLVIPPIFKSSKDKIKKEQNALTILKLVLEDIMMPQMRGMFEIVRLNITLSI